MATTLATLRAATLLKLDESEISNSAFADSAGGYTHIDICLNEAEGDIGAELVARGCKPELVKKSSTVTYTASADEVAWSTLDNTGKIPGSKIWQIWDVTDSNQSVEIPMVDMQHSSMYDPTGSLSITRYGAPRWDSGTTVAWVYRDYLVIKPKYSSARSLKFMYTPKLGSMTVSSDMVLPDEAAAIVATRAAILLKRAKGRDDTSLMKTYLEQINTMTQLMHQGKAGTLIYRRPRYKRP